VNEVASSVSIGNNPLISIVTPVHNGEPYLAECIESVLRQTYSNWEYVVVDNGSTDRTGEIARRYAQRDDRIRVHATDSLLPLLKNWNYALRQISPSSKYCKIVHADDWLFPECVQRMFDVAERFPTVGIVGAYRLDEDRVNLDGLPYPSEFAKGRDIGRWHLLGGDFLFGSPTSILVRSDLVRARHDFYNERNLHADTEVCFDLLREVDFGFVHQVLTFTRRHNESVTSTNRRLNTYLPSWLHVLNEFGRDYLSEQEYLEVVNRKLRDYYRFLGISLLRLRKRPVWQQRHEFWNYHRKMLLELGYPLSRARVARAAAVMLYNVLLEKLRVP
jgi:glycosyltransferase involved in cell wall biosynthesis